MFAGQSFLHEADSCSWSTGKPSHWVGEGWVPKAMDNGKEPQTRLLARARAEVLLKDRHKNKAHGVASLAGGGLTVPSLNIGRCPTVVWGRVAWRRSSVQRWGPWISVCFLFYFLQLLRYTWTKKPSLEYNFCFWTRHWLLLFTYFSSMPWLMWHPNFSYAVCSQMRMKMVCDAPGCGCVELFAHSLRHLTKAGLAENHLM